jgi:predicted DCC family thiol-disulfide oxidoreductase YuxK
MSDTRSIEPAPARPVLVYDGDCRFCRMWIERWRDATGDSVEYLAQQSPECASRFPQLDPVALQEAVHRVDTEGRVTRGAEAVLQTLADAPGWGRVARLGLESPVFLGIAEQLYRVVARNRVVFSTATRGLWGDSVRRPQWWVSREIFLVGLAAVHLVAFLSLWVQVDGLIGEKGVLPAAEFMARVGEQVNEQRIGWDRYRLLPTLGWWGAGDGVLHGLCGLGVLLAVVAVAGYGRALALFGLWLTYLSLSVLGQDFLAFQWDTLLLETTFLAVFLAPWRLGRMAARKEAPSRWARGLLVWLLFRLMLESGIVKLASGDPAWRSMTALEYHYWTQPLPGPGSWYVHHGPAWLHRACCVAMFVIELGLPWLVLAPRRLRGLAFLGFSVLQFVIMATGNYTFFNLLALLLGLLLVDDATWARWWRRGSGGMPIGIRVPPSAGGGEAWRRRLLVGVAVISLVIGARPLVGFVAPGWNGWSSGLDRWFAPFRTFNDYGLFAVMTTSRSEIVIEGSTDGLVWRAYEFRHKPGALDRRPGQVAPHQPRLDWQMWFAALGDVRRNPWLVRLGIRLLEGSGDVVGLLRDNPFPGSPPKYVRARMYAYRFSTPEERRSMGHWWVREEKGLYCPAFSLTDVGGTAREGR